MQYKKINCKNCQNEFVFSIEEQKLYQKRGLIDPSYCPICRGMMEARQKDVARSKYDR